MLDRKLPFARIGRIWPYVGDSHHPIIVYDYTLTRGRAGPAKFLEGYKGYLQADAYSVYDAFFKPERGMTEVGCWMLARRYVCKALEPDEQRMGPALHLIACLYGRGSRQGAFPVGRATARIAAACVGGLPITCLSDVIRDASLRGRLLSRSKNRPLVKYFAHQFDAVPKATLAAIERRMQSLLASESVRLALDGTAAPDFRLLQDDSRIVLINCFGENIARSVRRLLQGLVLSDIRQAVFARRKKDHPFLWFCDEAQNFFTSERLRDNMNDLLTMSRSFGSFFMYLTQNMTTAVGDARILKVLHTNIRWALCMRGDPADCEFLWPALPVRGRMLKPRTSPFEDRKFYPPWEERQLLLDTIANLPDRTGYLWFKSRASEAIKLTTADLITPADLDAATNPIRKDTTIGWRVSRKAYDNQVAERDLHWREPATDAAQGLEEAYRRKRG